jgi:outer membrane protein assembly factor BamE (lipoprotein component of BamABCDE complex)
MNRLFKFALVASFSVLASCMSAQEHKEAIGSEAASDNLTVGKVQREIRVGMSSAEVVEVLGSPNLVTTDEQRREVWVYDKISTESVRSSSGAYGTLILLGASTRSGASSTTQKTLTVVIKYDNESRVRDFAYRQSKF